jgi:hypothetical protein
MIIEKINDSERTKLLLNLDKLTKSLARRNVAFVITANSKYVGAVTLLVTGKRGTAQKVFNLVYDKTAEEWQLFSDGYVYKLLSLSEISLILKNRIQKLHTVLTKI